MDTCETWVNEGIVIGQCGATAVTVVFGADWQEKCCLKHAQEVREEILKYGPYAGWDTA